MSTVHVGLLDQKIENSQVVSWDINKIGGLPAWICTESSPSVPECKNCGQISSLISQIYCPLGGSEYNRCIYLFACPRDCSKQQHGWRVFRSMKHDSTYHPESEQATEISQQPSKCVDDFWSQDQDDWGGESDKWGVEPSELDDGSHVLPPYQESADQPAESDCGVACSETIEVLKPEIVNHDSGCPGSNGCLLQNNLETSSALPDDHQDTEESAVEETLSLADAERWNALAKLLNTKLEQDCSPTKLNSNRTIVFEPYYLSVVDEPAAKVEEVNDHVSHLIRNYEKSEGKQLHTMISDRPTSKAKDSSSEFYEKTELKHGDRIFYKFMKRLQRCPQQCIRYDRGGDPLLVSHLQDQPVSPCPHCGQRRIFEFQLLPPLIPFLRTVDGTPCEVEFGTVLVYTCEQNCWPADRDSTCKLDLLEESIVFQEDPDIHLYR
ncbi:unnamed protein product [Candidula unifasciata]|uniref:Programmed cell death protein 2 C-terminal domain-containing protein n=1 Tax=Candidula unifasciata TaxID=100452 RepID=A0A8S3Z6K9_9EUPU|nr:unnamed protein product [Candidula unifasciata]